MRNVGLDIVRAVCTVLVVFAHTNNILGKYVPGYGIVFPLGSTAQEVFFSLSGFLIGTQLLKFINKSFTTDKLFGFYLKRWIRTVPFYFIFIIINYLIYLIWYKNSGLEFFSSDFNVIEYFTFSQNLLHSHPAFYPEIWPIPIEEWSYLLIPIALILTLFIPGKSTGKYFVFVIVLLIILINVFRINYVLDQNPEQDWQLRKIVIYRADALLYGILLSVLVKEYEVFFRKYKLHLFLIGLVICLAGTFIVGNKGRYVNSILFLVLPLFSSLLLPFFRFTDFNASIFTRISTHISIVSYSVLLSHLYFLQFLFISLFHPDDWRYALSVTSVYLVVLVIFSTLFYNYVERPVLLLRKS